MKTCRICNTPKPEDNFAPLKHGRQGLHPWCRPCTKAYYHAKYIERKLATYGAPEPLTSLPWKSKV